MRTTERAARASDAAGARADAAGGVAAREDPYFAKLVKYIPAEIVAAYQALLGFIRAADKRYPEAILWTDISCVAILAVLTPVWMRYATADPVQGLPASRYQMYASAAAFLIWVFALDGLWASRLSPAFQDLRPMWSSMVLVIATVAIPLLERAFPKRA